MSREAFPSMSKAQKLYGTKKTTFIRPQYVDDGYCQWCGNLITDKRKRSFCSKECSHKFNVATCSLFYANQGSRGGYANHILRRDNYTCQKCGKSHAVKNEHGIKLPTGDGELEIHHIISVQYGGDNSPDNLITLCKKCHLRIHRGKEEQGAAKVGDVIRFAGSDDLYKIVCQEVSGELLARFCWDDARYSIEPGRLSKIVMPTDIVILVARGSYG